ncbi:MAG: type II toxin-antitoxin system RelE/ParE family toxin [Phycisphaeraceae bacterium]
MELIYHREAREELEEAIAYYEEQCEGLGAALQNEVIAAEHRIELAPERWVAFHPPFRRVLLNRFPYSVIYAIQKDYIFIVAVAHHRRQQGYWLDRMK